jgi:hypothetical protein
MSSWLDLCLSNKNGRGDGTGLLPTEALEFISQFCPMLANSLPAPGIAADPCNMSRSPRADEYYFGGSDRDVERQAIFASMFQQRCTSYGSSELAFTLLRRLTRLARSQTVPATPGTT